MSLNPTAQRGLLLIALLPLLLVAACGTPPPLMTGTPTTSPTTGTPAGVTPVSTGTASTRLCDLMPLGQVSAVVGGTLSVLQRGVTTMGGTTAVNCTYLPSQGSGLHLAAEISYAFTPNGPAAYAKNQQDDASRHETETTLNGLGDAAFWAVSPTHSYTLQLSVLKGNVLLIMTLLGANPSGSSMLHGTVGLANLALPSL